MPGYHFIYNLTQNFRGASAPLKEDNIMLWLMSTQQKSRALVNFASEASGPQKTQKFDLVGKNVTSTGKKNTFER